MRELAHHLGGECVSTDYVNVRTHLRWRCAAGHEWEASPANVKRGHWCPFCCGNQIWAPGQTEEEARLRECHELAKAMGGLCLSISYANIRTLIRWRCSEGYEWDAQRGDVKSGHWCPHCAGRAQHTIPELQAVAKEREGECLSMEYGNNKGTLRWRCSQGHEWECSANHILRGHWCPRCSNGQHLMEALCREFLEKITENKWQKHKPKWLINERGHRMELDGLCEAICVAFEYHGRQHYEHNPHFHRGKHTFERRQGDDQRKRELCEAHGIKLIEVPYTVEPDNLFQFLADRLSEAVGKQYAVPPGMVVGGFGYDRGYLDELRSLARAQGGECLATTYLGVEKPIRWLCRNGHEWEARPHSIKGGGWCPFCAGKRAWSPGKTENEARLEECHILADLHGGQFLSLQYTKALAPHQWRCSEGHEWTATPNGVKNGHWCSICARKNRKKSNPLDPGTA